MIIFVAPTEPRTLKALGRVSMLPESKGVDIAWCIHATWWGVQRKAFPGDFLASIADGRLNKELAQMAGGVDVAFLVLEGFPAWSSDGELYSDLSRPGRDWTQASMAGCLASIQVLKNVHILWTMSLNDTIRQVAELISWCQKTAHEGMNVRPKTRNPWASGSNPDWQSHALQAIPGVGPGAAKAIVAHFGRLPILWDCTLEQLMEVRGVGLKTARLMMHFFNQEKEATQQ